MGTVIVAGTAVGIFDTYEDAIKKFLTLGKTYTPDCEKNKKYSELYKNYKKMYGAIRPIID